jgi:hypothetical protein
VMGSALRLHPLLVIFGLLAGGEIYGLAGALVALPMLAAGRAAWEFFSERVELEPWEGGEVPVEVEVEQRPPPPAPQPVRPSGAAEPVWGSRDVPPEDAPTVSDQDDSAAASGR